MITWQLYMMYELMVTFFFIRTKVLKHFLVNRSTQSPLSAKAVQVFKSVQHVVKMLAKKRIDLSLYSASSYS